MSRARSAASLRAALLLALAALPAFAAPPRDVDVDVASDPEAAWAEFRAHAGIEKALEAYGVVDALSPVEEELDAEACRTNAGKLDAALRVVPVSLALHRSALLCAEATGDQARAEHELEAFASLSRHALSMGGEAGIDQPMPVFSTLDAMVLVRAAGLEWRYAYYPFPRAGRYLPYVVAAWDAEAGRERHLVFDYVDVLTALHRDNALYGFPLLRDAVANEAIKGGAEGGLTPAIDLRAMQKAIADADKASRLKLLRDGATSGGVISAASWATLCQRDPSSDCASLVDILLPAAEKGYVVPTTLLALARVTGVGVARDEAAGWALLDQADARAERRGALELFASLWTLGHPGQARPAPLQARLEQAREAGVPFARRQAIVEALEDDKPALSQADLAFLAAPAQNTLGWGERHLARYLEARGDTTAALEHLRRAAGQGNTEAQADYGSRLIFGRDVPRDRDAGEAMLREAAHGGSAWAARYLADASLRQGRYADAERWLARPADTDADALFQLAQLYAADRPGLNGDAKRAVELYRLIAADPTHGPRARRALAMMAIQGRGMTKDPDQARRWLLQDAERGDHDSEAQLGLGYLYGQFGAKDEAQGRRWVQRAMDAKEQDVYVDYGQWLFDRGDAASRREALDIWARGQAAGNQQATNNIAWALCTAAYDDVLDPRRGLTVAAQIGEVDDLPGGELDTVAACHAANGEFDRAVELQQRAARELAALDGAPTPDQDEPRGYDVRLQLYRDRKPYRQAPSKQ